MFTIVDILYREYCRARLAEMRKQLLIPAAGGEIVDAPWETRDPCDADDQSGGWTTKEPQPSGSWSA